MSEVVDYAQPGAFLRALDSKAIDCRQQIAAMRRLIDQACDRRTIRFPSGARYLNKPPSFRPDVWISSQMRGVVRRRCQESANNRKGPTWVR